MKNKYYLIILFASLTVCGTVVLRPQVADRVLGLLGLRDEAASPYVSPELVDLSDSSPKLDTVMSLDNDFDGMAVANPVPMMPPMFGEAYSAASQESLEGVAMSGQNSLTGFNRGANSFNQDANDETSGFGAYVFSGASVPAQTASPGIEVNFGTDAHNGNILQQTQTGNDVSGIQFAFAATSPSDITQVATTTPTTGSAVSQQIVMPPANNPSTPIGFADFVSTNEGGADAGFASSNRSNIQQPAGLQNGYLPGEDIALAGASIVQPDPVHSDFSGVYFSEQSPNNAAMIGHAVSSAAVNAESHQIITAIAEPVGTSSDANIVAAATYNQPVGQQAISQPFAQPVEQQAGNIAIQNSSPQTVATQTVPPQVATPQTATTQQHAVPQFIIPPTFEPAQTVAPLATGPSQPFSLTQPEQVAAGYQHSLQGGHSLALDSQNTSNNAGNVAQNTMPPEASGNMSHDHRQSQYEQEVITEIETVLGSEMLARVGMKNVVMACDIMAEIRESLESRWDEVCKELGETPTIEEEREYKAQGMQALFEQTLDNWIELQMLYLDLSVNFPAEQLEEIRKAEAKNFDMLIMPQMMEQYGVTNRYDLDKKLRSYGTTLERKRASTIEKRLAQGWFGEVAKPQKSLLASDDMFAYYEQHKEEKYKVIGQAEWEELAVFFSECQNEQEAYAKIAELGNSVMMQGKPFAEAAKQGSHGLTAYRGGERDARFGSLTTKTLEEAVFSLPIGQMSQIIRENSGPCAGVYIVRVKKRADNGYTPFADVQRDIQNAIDGERFMIEQNRVLTKLKQTYPVFKNPNLQQIAAMAANAERNVSASDLAERRIKPQAKVEQQVPQQQPQFERVARANVAQTANVPPINRPDTRTGNPTSTWEPGLGTTIDKEGEKTRKEETKKSFWNALNPFK